jgi:Spy/CpxP family protein refolding chaperone
MLGGGRGIGFLAGYLNLTDTQKTQAEAIFEAARTAAEPIRGRMKSSRESLTDAVKSAKSDTEIDALAASVGTLSGQLTAIQSKAMVKFRAILTPEQIEKLDSRGRRRGLRSGE